VIGEAPNTPSGSQRFRARHRIRSSRDYARSRSEGRRVGSSSFTLEATPNPFGARLGLVVSRRVGNAVVRNRTKRRIREWFRAEVKARVARLDLVVIARGSAAGLESQALRDELSQLVGRLTR
jgi:ribonuclease P protein component